MRPLRSSAYSPALVILIKITNSLHEFPPLVFSSSPSFQANLIFASSNRVQIEKVDSFPRGKNIREYYLTIVNLPFAPFVFDQVTNQYKYKNSHNVIHYIIHIK